MSSLNGLTNSISRVAHGLTGIYQEKVRTDLAFQLEQDKQLYASKLNEFQQNPSNYENWMNDLESYSREIRANGSEQFKTPGADKAYEQASLQLANQYRNQVQTLYTGQMVKDGQTKQASMVKSMIENTPWASDEEYNSHISHGLAKIRSSMFYTDEEKKIQEEAFLEDSLNKAMLAGAQNIFNTTEGTYSEKARAAEAFVTSNTYGGSALSAEKQSDMNQLIRSWETTEFTRQNRINDEEDAALDKGIWGLIKNGNISEAKKTWLSGNFHNEDNNKFWDSYFKTWERQTDAIASAVAKGEAEKQTQLSEVMVHELEEQVEQGLYSNEEAKEITREWVNDYGLNPNMGDAFMAANEKYSNPKLTDNEAYKSGIAYLETMNTNEGLKKNHPLLYYQIESRLKEYAMDEKNADNKDPSVFRQIVDDYMREPTIKQLNDNDRIMRGEPGWLAVDSRGINTSEKITQEFQDGNFRSLLKMKEDGTIDTERYKEWLKAWGYEDIAGGDYMEIEKTLDNYLKDFHSATMRDFPGRYTVHLDETTGRPVVEQSGNLYVLQIVDNKEKARLKEMGISVTKNSESWYVWNDNKKQYEFFKEVGE